MKLFSPYSYIDRAYDVGYPTPREQFCKVGGGSNKGDNIWLAWLEF